MPYTRNTRIKTTKHLYRKESVAEVEYRYPFTNITEWVAFNDSYNVLSCIVGKESVPYKALIDCSVRAADNITDEEFARMVIDEYHRMLDEQGYVPEVTYTKYPD